MKQILVVIITFTFFNYSYAGDELLPNQSMASEVYLLLDDESGIELTQSVITHWSSRSRENPIPALVNPNIEGIGFVFHDELRTAEGQESSTKARLARYMLISLSDQLAAESLVQNLQSDNRVLYAGLRDPIELHTPDECSFASAVTPVNQDLYPKSWAQDLLRIEDAHNLARGHAYISVVDTGIDQQHPNLKDFAGQTYIGGNFHQHLAIDIGGRSWDDNAAAPAHPFGAAAVFGWVDEYQMNAVPENSAWPNWRNCDAANNGGNQDGFIQNRFAGHGTHVAGLAAGSPLQPEGWRGACLECPLQIMKANYGWPNPLTCFDPEESFQPNTEPEGSVPYEASFDYLIDVYAGIALAVDVGAQIVNISGGASNVDCDSQPMFAGCLALDYASKRGVMIFASVGNENDHEIHFPASDNRAFGVAGLQISGARWSSSATCGSNIAGPGAPIATWPALAAPAHMVYSTMYPNMNYSPAGCHVGNDGDLFNGFGYCTGTSMAAPLVSGIAGLVRSIMPLAESQEVFEALRLSTDRVDQGLNQSNELGWGAPRADAAVQSMLGVANGQQVVNRLTPLFQMFSPIAGDSLALTKPQVAVAFANNSLLEYDSVTASPEVSGYAFPFLDEVETPIVPRADVFLLTTHVSPVVGAELVPLRRMRYLGGSDDPNPNPNNMDTALVEPSRIAAFHSVGYEMEGIEGYIFSHKTAAPDQTVGIWRAYNEVIDDHAVFPDSRKNAMESAGYTIQMTLLGYAFPNVDSDGDGLIDGMELILGTDPLVADSNCDGVSDGSHYPMYGLPLGDPLEGGCSADLAVSATVDTNQSIVTSTIENLGPADSDGFLLTAVFKRKGILSTFSVSTPAGCDAIGDTDCPLGEACIVEFECSVADLSSDGSLSLSFQFSSNKPVDASFHFEVVPTGVIDDPVLSNNERKGKFVVAGPHF